jgi:uncharacterized membrane protein
MKPKEFFQALNQWQVSEAIAEAERRTSGQIRVCVSGRNVPDALAAARRRFLKLGMDQTAARNGVLIYFCPRAQKYAVVGDRGIHERCGGDEFWHTVVDGIMRPLLKEGRFTEAVVGAVGEVGRQLAIHFPSQPGGPNELSNVVDVE